MQPSRPVSAPREYVMTDEDMIISKTDTRGKITYANRDFMRICGYSEPQLLGQPHSLIRHPEAGWDTHLRAAIAAGSGACLAAGASPPSAETIERLAAEVKFIEKP